MNNQIIYIALILTIIVTIIQLSKADESLKLVLIVSLLLCLLVLVKSND